MMKKIVIFLTALVLAICVNAQNVSTVKHEVLSGETLSSIARSYGISVKQLLKLNPSLNPDYIMAGQKINVPAGSGSNDSAKQNTQQTTVPVKTNEPVVPATKPDTQTKPATVTTHATTVTPAKPAATTQTTVTSLKTRPKYKTTHEVQKKETIFSISKLYNITEDQLIAANPQLKGSKLKKGEVLNIPYTDEENRKYEEERRRIEEEAKKPKVTKYSTIHCAVILPFSLGSEQMTTEAQKMANIYQGFLLAVDSLKGRGYSVDVYAYDESSENIDEIMAKPMMKNMQLIVGPVRQGHISTVAKFANTNKIMHVVPLSNDLSVVNEHPYTYQVNISNSLIYSQVYNRFKALHRNDNIIFVGMNDKADNNNFVIDFKKSLDEDNIIYSRATVSEFSKIREMLKTGVRNVIVPSSGSAAAFNTLCTKMNSLNVSDNYNIQFFGFPEWQTLPSKHEKNLAKYNCQFFSTFYSNNSAPRTQSFNSNFRQWFKQPQFNSFPHYGELGFDIGAYFIRGLRDYGSSIQENMHNITYRSLEFPFNFERKNSWSGYQNKSVLFVTYNLDGRVFVR